MSDEDRDMNVRKCHGCEQPIHPLQLVSITMKAMDRKAPQEPVPFHFHHACSAAYAQGQIDACVWTDPEIEE